MIPADPLELGALALLVFAAAVLYSSVGHAGASGYLAAMTLFGVAPAVMKPAALVMNIVVAVVGTWRFGLAGLVPWRLLAPLVAGSVPAAFLGGFLQLPTRGHKLLLGAVLLFAAARLLLLGEDAPRRRSVPGAPALFAAGLLMGFVAGLTGVGGGIFLSPLLLLAGWEETRRTAGASVAFILANSVSGLLGHLQAGRGLSPGLGALAVVALAGGLLGSWLGVRRFQAVTLRRLLAGVLVIAGGKLLVY